MLNRILIISKMCKMENENLGFYFEFSTYRTVCKYSKTEHVNSNDIECQRLHQFGHLPPCSCVLECDYVAVSCRVLSSRCRFIFELRKMRFASSPCLILRDSKTQLIHVNCQREDNLTITNNNFALQEEARESKNHQHEKNGSLRSFCSVAW